MKSSSEQKYLARSIKTTREDLKEWERRKFEAVFERNVGKFGQDADLRERLVHTGDRELVEAAPNDRVWGVGFDETLAEANRESWGQNLLGKALMSVRERLRGDVGEDA